MFKRIKSQNVPGHYMMKISYKFSKQKNDPPHKVGHRFLICRFPKKLLGQLLN